jgi:GNAT superfamily N-acetyltransferase
MIPRRCLLLRPRASVRSADAWTIRRLDAAEALASVPALSEVLMDCVNAGASVGFMQPITLATATGFWEMVAEGVARRERVLLVATDADERIVGTVQLVFAVPENQPHRADVAKMLVHSTARRRGIAAGLLQAVEEAARAENRTVLVLDAVTNGDAARLYARSGWQRVGDVPDFALMPDGPCCSTTYFYKSLGYSTSLRGG